MSQRLKRLNSRETKKVKQMLESQYGFTGNLDLIFFMHEKKLKIYVFNKTIDEIDLEGFAVDTMGMYFGTIFEDKIRLSIEGSQIVGPGASTNILEIPKELMQKWIQGNKLEIAELGNAALPEQGHYVIIKSGDDFIGCGKVSGDAVSNYIPKTRYVHALYD